MFECFDITSSDINSLLQCFDHECLSYIVTVCHLSPVVRPVSATCKLVLNKASASVMPRLMVDFTLDDIEVLISRLQVNCSINYLFLIFFNFF